MSSLRLAAGLVFAIALGGCRGTHPEMVVAQAPAEDVAGPASAADDNLNAVAWHQTSMEYQLIALQTFRAATHQLDRALGNPAWDALTEDDRDTPAAGLRPAVIVDVDETVLDNSPYQARLVRDNQTFNEFSWASWTREEAALAVPGALAFAQAAHAKGVTVFYVSNRAEDLNEVTVNNLRKLGFPIADRAQFLGLGAILEGCEENGSEKSCRRRSVGRHHRVLMQVGDQIGDMVTVIANTPTGRQQAIQPYLKWVGERWFVLPNATYGSWEPALFNNDWSQPADARRKQKIDALRY